MTDFVTEPEFTEIVARHRSGEARVTLPRQVAKQFFLRIDNPSVKATTGDSIFFKKFVVWLFNVASPVTFVIAMSLIFKAYGPWEASFILPAAGICWIIIYGLTSEHGGWLIGTVPLILTLPLLSATGMDSGLPVFLFVLSIWLQRSSYLLAGRWLTEIVTSSYAAFEMMEEHITIKESNRADT